MKDVNEMSLDEFDFYIQSQGFATSHKVADPQKVPEGVMSKADEKDVYRDMDERDDTDGFSPEYDAYEKARLDDEPTAAEFAKAEAEHDALMNDLLGGINGGCVMTITENGEALSARQFWKRVKAVLKEDPVMSGSGHLYLSHKLPYPLPDRALASVQTHALEALKNQGIEGFDEDKTRARIAMILLTIAQPGRGKPQAQPKPKPKRDPRQKRQRKPDRPERAAYQRPQPPAPVIQVTIKRARNFHYPLDLPTPTPGQNGTGGKS